MLSPSSRLCNLDVAAAQHSLEGYSLFDVIRSEQLMGTGAENRFLRRTTSGGQHNIAAAIYNADLLQQHACQTTS